MRPYTYNGAQKEIHLVAIIILLIGVVVFGAGIVGQVGLARRRRKITHPQDRKGAGIVITIASIIVGAWLAIWAIATLLHAHLHGAPR